MRRSVPKVLDIDSEHRIIYDRVEEMGQRIQVRELHWPGGVLTFEGDQCWAEKSPDGWWDLRIRSVNFDPSTLPLPDWVTFH